MGSSTRKVTRRKYVIVSLASIGIALLVVWIIKGGLTPKEPTGSPYVTVYWEHIEEDPIGDDHHKGHKEGRKGNKDIHSFGLNIKLPMEQVANKHLDIKKDFERFSERLDYFMYLSNIVVVAPGGIGTLLELYYTWQLVQVKHTCNIPIILLGPMWPTLIKWMEKWQLDEKLVSPEDMHTIFLANDCKEAMKVIKKTNDEFKKGNPDFCKTYQKYKID